MRFTKRSAHTASNTAAFSDTMTEAVAVRGLLGCVWLALTLGAIQKNTPLVVLLVVRPAHVLAWLRWCGVCGHIFGVNGGISDQFLSTVFLGCALSSHIALHRLHLHRSNRCQVNGVTSVEESGRAVQESSRRERWDSASLPVGAASWRLRQLTCVWFDGVVAGSME